MNQIKYDPLKSKRILVVGGSGFIGKHVVRGLLREEAQVTIMDVVPPPEHIPGADMVVGSITDTSLLSSAAAGCDIVVFLASSSLPGSANTDLAAEVRAHVEYSIKAAECCCAQGVKRFVFSSSGGTVYGYSSNTALSEDMPTRPINAYGVSKVSIENYLRLIQQQRGMTTVSLRISNPYGEEQKATRNQGFIAAAMQSGLSGKTLSIWGDGTVERDFIYINDVSKAFVAACKVQSPSEIINIGSGKPSSLLEVLKYCEKALDRKIPVQFQSGRKIDVHRNYLDITHANINLNWAPEVSLRDGINKTAQWWINNMMR